MLQNQFAGKEAPLYPVDELVNAVVGPMAHRHSQIHIREIKLPWSDNSSAKKLIAAAGVPEITTTFTIPGDGPLASTPTDNPDTTSTTPPYANTRYCPISQLNEVSS